MKSAEYICYKKKFLISYDVLFKKKICLWKMKNKFILYELSVWWIFRETEDKITEGNKKDNKHTEYLHCIHSHSLNSAYEFEFEFEWNNFNNWAVAKNLETYN